MRTSFTKIKSSMLRLIGVFALVFATLWSPESSAQIAPVFYDFTSNTMGWTGTTGMSWTTSLPCGGTGGAVRRNAFGATSRLGGSPSWANGGGFISPALTGANASLMTVQFDYKVTNWIAGTVATPATWGTLLVQDAPTPTGPWTTRGTINAGFAEHVPSTACTTRVVTFNPTPGTVHVRFVSTWNAGDYWLYLDNISISQPLPTCSGTPAPGNTLTSSATACSGSTVNLSLSNTFALAGISYQWQSGPSSGGPWTNIGTNIATHSPVVTATTWYRCNVTCSTSGLTGSSTPIEVTLNPFLNCYTLGFLPTSTFDEEIFNTTVGTLNQSSTCATLAPGPGSILNRYSNYRGFASVPDLARTTSVSFSLNQQSCGGAFNNGFIVYIDFNQNGLFTDAGEKVYTQPTTVSGNQTVTGTFTVPVGAALGNTGMRVVNAEVTFPTALDYGVTSGFSWGEVEDYLVNITPAPACAPPSAGTATGVTATSANLSWSGGAGTYDVEWGVLGFTPTLSPSAGFNDVSGSGPHLLSGLSGLTQYSFYVRRDCGGSTSSWVGPFTFATTCGVASCSYTVRMTDTFGDGWNGNTMSIIQNGITVGTVGSTFTTGVGPVDATITVCEGVPFQFRWNSGGAFANEVGAQLIDPFGSVLYTKAPGVGAQNTILFSGTGLCTNATDISPLSLTAPQGVSCGGPALPVSVTVRNSGTDPINFATNPLTVTVTCVPAAGGPFTATVNTGTLAPGANLVVSLAPAANLSVSGTYTFTVTAGVTGDTNPGNNTLATNPTRIISAYTGGFPFTQQFGAAPNPDWLNQLIVQTGFTAPAWSIVTTGNTTLPTLTPVDPGYATFNSYNASTGSEARLILPCMDFSSMVSPGLTFRMSQDNGFAASNDSVVVQYSTNGGNTWLRLGAYTRLIASAAQWTTFDLPMCQLAGLGSVRLAFLGKSAFGNNIHIDQVTIQDNPACPIPGSLTATGVSVTGATFNWSNLATCGASSYEVEYGPVGGPYTPVTGILTNTSTITAAFIPGQTYQFRVRTNCGGPTSLYSGFLNFTIPFPIPTNDGCPGALLTAGLTCVNTSGYTNSATPSGVATPICSGFTGNPDDDVWYQFQATGPAGTNYTITAVPDLSSVDPASDLVLALYQNNSCTVPNLNTCADATAGTAPETVTLVNPAPGSIWRIRVYTFGAGIVAGAFNICVVRIPPPPVNDNCAGAVSLTPNTLCLPVTGQVAFATPSVPAASCGSGNSNDDVWYSFTATSTTHEVTVVGAPTFNPVLEFLSGTCGSLTSVSCADLSVDGGTEVLNLPGLFVGTTYYVRVFDFDAGYPLDSNFTICVTDINVTTPPPANDACANATSLTSTPTCTPVSGTTNGATNNLPVLPGNLCGSIVGNADDDVWYQFVATSSAQIIEVVGSGSLDPVVELRTGVCAGGTLIQCADATGVGATETLSVGGLTVGQTYRVRVYGSGAGVTTQGDFTICVYEGIPLPAPGNDNCAGATNLTSAVACNYIAGSVSGATGSTPAVPCGGTANDDVWYKFTATSTAHNVTVDPSNSMDVAFVVYNGGISPGTCTGTLVGCFDITGTNGNELANLSGLTVGNTYFIRVYDVGASVPLTTGFQICVQTVTPPPPPVNDNCSGAIVLIPGSTCSNITGNANGATPSGVAISCGGVANDDLWYRFVATSTIHRVQVVGSSGYDAVIEVFTGTACGTLTNLGCADNSFVGGGTEVLNLLGLTVGSTYWVRVYDWYAANPLTPTFDICVVAIPAPPLPVNDLCPDAIGVACGSLITGQNSAGGTSTGDPTGTCGTGVSNINGIWYRLIGDGNGYQVNTCNFNGYDTRLAVFSGSCGTLTCVGGNDDTPGCGDGLASSVTFNTTNGVTYYILVGGSGGAQGIFQLQVNCCTAPTIPGTVTVTPDPLENAVNDSYTFALQNTNGIPTLWEFSVPGFPTVTGTFPGSPSIQLINNVNGNLNFRAQVSAGPGCATVATPVLVVTPRCASTINGQPQNTGNYITNVEVANLNYNSTYDLTTFDQYQNFTSQVATVNRGAFYQLKIKTFGVGSFGRAAWADWNDDGDFLDGGELLFTPVAPLPGTSTHVFSIPCNAALTSLDGEVRMRVLSADVTPNTNPCAAIAYASGQIEEYTLKIVGDGFGTWLGTVDNNWNNANNWACASVPTNSIDVDIPLGAPNQPIVLNGAAVCRNITFNTAAPFFVATPLNLNGNTLSVHGDFFVTGSGGNPTLTFSGCSGIVSFTSALGAQNVFGRVNFGNLTINNTFGVTLNNNTSVSCVLRTNAGALNSGNFLTLRSTSTATALIDPGTLSGSVLGNVTVQRRIGGTSGYHYLSSAVAGSLVNSATNGWIDDFFINPLYDNYVYDPTIPVVSTFPSVWEYDETNTNPNSAYGWIGATGADAILPLKGFACVVPANATVDVTGVVNNGLVTAGQQVTNTPGSEGFNLIGNPYPSPISWNAFRGHNPSLSATYQAFVSSGGYTGNYGTYNGFTGTNGVDNVIASSQGFFVTALTNATLTAINTDRTTDVNPTFFSNSYTAIPNLLRMEVQGMGTADEAVVYFDPAASDQYDTDHDGLKIFSIIPGVAGIYTIGDNHNLSINVMGALNQDRVMPLGVRISTAGSYDLVATDMSSMEPTLMVYLEDVVTGTMQNLRMNPTYNVTLADGDYSNRFFLRFSPAMNISAQSETCSGMDGTIQLNYPSAGTVSVAVKDANGVVISSMNNFNGVSQVSNLAGGNYTVEVTYAGGYVSTDYVQVGSANAVTANLSASASSVALGSNSTVLFTATANGATSFNWNFGDGTVITNGPANVSHTFTTAGVYDVTFEASNSACSAVSSVTVEVFSPSGISNGAAEGISISAVENRVMVQFGNLADGRGKIEVMNLLGQNMVELNVPNTKGSREVVVPSPAVGHYLVRVTSDGKVVTRKVYLTK